MTISSKTIKALGSQIGIEKLPISYEIENGMIRRFAQAVGDPNPLWQDKGYALKTNYNGIIAPPNFVLTLGFDKILLDFMSDSEITILHGSTELESYNVIRPEDTITATSSITNIRERCGEKGNMLFITFGIRYFNQKEELIATCRQTAILY